jgi:GLPGLI family protein
MKSASGFYIFITNSIRMKKRMHFLVVFVVTICMFSITNAQKLVNEATITYNISITSADSKTDLGRSLDGAQLVLYIRGNQSRSDMNSSLGTESTLFDSKSGKGFILKEYSGQKLMITLNKENWLQKNQAYADLDFTFDNAEVNIAGHTCRKASAVLSNGKIFTVYYTTEIELSNRQYNPAFSKIKGLPVQYELESGKLTFRYQLANINYEPVAYTKFEAPKSGFRTMTFEENQQLKKGIK